jgi:hypothetical protein
MPESTIFDKALFPVGRGSQGSSIFLIGASKLRDASPEPVLPAFLADAAGIVSRNMSAPSSGFVCADSNTPQSNAGRARQSLKCNRGQFAVQAKSNGMDRFLSSKPEELLCFARRLFRNTSLSDPGKSTFTSSLLACTVFLIIG